MAKHTFEAYAAGYRQLWDTMVIRQGDEYDAAIATAVANVEKGRETYKKLEADTGVPWFLIAFFHKMECNCDFTKHLHNGDTLAKRTVRKPAGRPTKGKPPFTFYESAIDALTLKGYHKIKDWSLERIAYESERYNGFGYRQFGVPSPYLWSFSQHYVRGKYVVDGKYSASAVSKQVGVMVTLKALALKDPSVDYALSNPGRPLTPVEPEQMDETEILAPARGPSVYDRVVDAVVDFLLVLFGRKV